MTGAATPAHRDEPAPVDAAGFRSVLGRFATGVAVVTVTTADGRPYGFTVSSFTAVSQDPPLVSFCIGGQASAWPAVAGARTFVAHLLDGEQEELSRLFATSGADRFGPPTRWSAGKLGDPVLDGVLAHLECRVERIVPAGDHHLVLGTPLVAADDAGRAPLLYFRGGYHRLAS